MFIESFRDFEMAGEGKGVELTQVEYYDAAEKAKVGMITEEIMASLFDDSDDSEEFDFEEDNVDADDRSYWGTEKFWLYQWHFYREAWWRGNYTYSLEGWSSGSEVHKKFDIYLHQLTPNALVRLGIFIWTVRSQGVEPNTDLFCQIYELHYQTKATSNEQLHNNFSRYNFLVSKRHSVFGPSTEASGQVLGQKNGFMQRMI